MMSCISNVIAFHVKMQNEHWQRFGYIPDAGTNCNWSEATCRSFTAKNHIIQLRVQVDRKSTDSMELLKLSQEAAIL